MTAPRSVTNLFGEEEELPEVVDSGALQRRFVVPPFSVLDARQPYWRDRKTWWREVKGIRGSFGREDLGATVLQGQPADSWMQRGATDGGSAFDPVLCEITYRWFCPPGGLVLDPFAGEATKGLVAGHLGFGYAGIELREEQVAINAASRDALGLPADRVRWIHGDGSDARAYGHTLADLIFTSPPYFDLEVYSDKDASAAPDYLSFMQLYWRVFEQAICHLRPNRFLVVKVGEIRDRKTGEYRGFVADNIKGFQVLGLMYYNEAVLVTPIGSLPLKVGTNFGLGRKLGKAHQNVLVFVKGDPRTAVAACGQAPEVAAVPDAAPEEP